MARVKTASTLACFVACFLASFWHMLNSFDFMLFSLFEALSICFIVSLVVSASGAALVHLAMDLAENFIE